MANAMKKKREEDRMKEREKGFQLERLEHVRLAPYNALFDPNMRHFFENRKVQRILYESGQIDKHGRVVDEVKAKPKIHILEREFREAEKIEERRQKEELEMRYRVQRKRFEELERMRKEEILAKLKMDRELSKEIISTMRASTSSTSPSVRSSSSKREGFGRQSRDMSIDFMRQGHTS